jgi:hypothetical protein
MAKGTDTRAKGPKANGPKATDSKVSAPKASAAQASDGKAGDSKADGTKSRAPKAKAATATAVAPSSTKSKAPKSSAAKSKAGDSMGKASNAAQSKRATRLAKKIASFERQESKLAKQLDKVHDRQSAARVRLSTLAPAPAAPPASSTKPSTDGEGAEHTAFCLREKRRVAVIDARPTVLRNGRTAIAGVCASCGAKIVTLVAGPH